MRTTTRIVLLTLAFAACTETREPLSPANQSLRPAFQLVPGSGTWTTKAPMPTARKVPGVGVVNGLFYAIGGGVTGGVLTANEAYDAGSNTWSTRAPMISSHYGAQVGVVNGIIYAIGGSSGESCGGAPVANVEA